MARYIDADVLMRFLQVEDFGTPDERWKPESEFAQMIDATPTADVAEVKQGHWEWHTALYVNPIDGMDEDFAYRCSECHVWAGAYDVDDDIFEEPPTNKLHYCPNCGAKMDGGEE